MILFLGQIQNFEGMIGIVEVENYKRMEDLNSLHSYSEKTKLLHELPSMVFEFLM